MSERKGKLYLSYFLWRKILCGGRKQASNFPGKSGKKKGESKIERLERTLADVIQFLRSLEREIFKGFGHQWGWADIEPGGSSDDQ